MDLYNPTMWSAISRVILTPMKISKPAPARFQCNWKPVALRSKHWPDGSALIVTPNKLLLVEPRAPYLVTACTPTLLPDGQINSSAK